MLPQGQQIINRNPFFSCRTKKHSPLRRKKWQYPNYNFQAALPEIEAFLLMPKVKLHHYKVDLSAWLWKSHQRSLYRGRLNFLLSPSSFLWSAYCQYAGNTLCNSSHSFTSQWKNRKNKNHGRGTDNIYLADRNWSVYTQRRSFNKKPKQTKFRNQQVWAFLPAILSTHKPHLRSI